jgi:hypothetical protein
MRVALGTLLLLVSSCGSRVDIYEYKAPRELRAIRDELDAYGLANGRAPSSELECESWLTRRGWKGLPIDPWGRPYQYRTSPNGLEGVFTLGRDGVPGGQELDTDISDQDLRVPWNNTASPSPR